MSVSVDLAVAPGLAVAVNYRLELDGGVTASKSEQPVWFVHGEPGLPPKLQQALLGLRAGAQVSVRLEPTDAFGEQTPTLVKTLPRAHFTDAEPLVVGKHLIGRNDVGMSMKGVVASFDAAKVTIDFNPPLAGAPVTAVMRVVEVRAKLPVSR